MDKVIYVTVDDSPTSHTRKMLEMFREFNISAIFFCRGDRIVEHFDVALRILDEGHHIGNHSHDHRPSSELTVKDWFDDLQRTEVLINQAYYRAGIARPGKYYRFPYLDRGDGMRLEELLSQVETGHRKLLLELNNSALQYQNLLRLENFVSPYSDLNHPVFCSAKENDWRDSLITYSTFDWKLTARHTQREGATLDGLKNRILADFSNDTRTKSQVILFHDDPDDLTAEIKELITLYQRFNFTFRSI